MGAEGTKPCFFRHNQTHRFYENIDVLGIWYVARRDGTQTHLSPVWSVSALSRCTQLQAWYRKVLEMFPNNRGILALTLERIEHVELTPI